MQVTLYNTLSKSKEVLEPLETDHVRMYVCGPTVYTRAHIGNARAMVVFDAWYRLLNEVYPKVTYVRNITDVDDKINKAAKERNVDISVVTDETTQAFHDDMAALNCEFPTKEPRATEHIDAMITMIQTLIDKDSAYEAEGHVLFAVASYEAYGNLSRRSRDEMVAGARVEVAPYKKDPADFVLWKPSSDDEPGWDSPWGRGRPGWHIECSAMSTAYLGETFDVHGGGIDLQFPHHENEIAQSCCANPGSGYAKHWVHNGFLTVNGEKMSKSLGNFFTVGDLLKKGIHGETMRYLLLASHYRKPLDWNDKGVEDAKKSLDSFYRALEVTDSGGVTKDQALYEEFVAILADDLNTPGALAFLHELSSKVHKAEVGGQEQKILVASLKACGDLLGLLQEDVASWFAGAAGEVDTDAIEALIAKRMEARKAKDWAESDRIRDELAAQGIILEDRPDGTAGWRKA